MSTSDAPRLRLGFFGAGAFGAPTLDALHARHDVRLVVTQPARPAGRKRVLTPTPLADRAVALGLPVEEAKDVNTHDSVDRVADLHLDASVVIAFGQKLGEPLIAAMGRLAVNLHGSLLPAYRGAAPIQRAVMNGETTAGVCVIGLAQRMDAGPIYASASLRVRPTETAGELHDRLAALGPDAVLRVLDELSGDRLRPVEQDESLATRARKLSKADGTVDFDQPADVVRARINGLNPWPGCRVRWTRAGEELAKLILRRAESASDDTLGDRTPPGVAVDDAGRIACADGVCRLLELQAPGKPTVSIEDFLRGRPILPGDRFETIAQEKT
ncbi:MAG: methionyl-tRNA formyltransferase [Planctomycetota bacterium]